LSGRPAHRGLIVASVIAAVGLVVGSVTLVLLVADRGPTSNSGAYGAISCSAPRLPGSTVTVRVTDAGDSMMSQAPMMATLGVDRTSVPAGRVSFVVPNAGALVHELVVLPLPTDGPGTRPTGADGKIDESQSLGEASRSCGSGTGDGIAPGSTGWTTISLQPGRYELVCDQPWHYAAGMFDVLTVT